MCQRCSNVYAAVTLVFCRAMRWRARATVASLPHTQTHEIDHFHHRYFTPYRPTPAFRYPMAFPCLYITIVMCHVPCEIGFYEASAVWGDLLLASETSFGDLLHRQSCHDCSTARCTKLILNSCAT